MTKRTRIFIGILLAYAVGVGVLLLRLLVHRPGRVFSREELLDQVWDQGAESFDRTVDAHIKTLRAKLKAVAPEVEAIRTLRGIGYALQEDLPPRP